MRTLVAVLGLWLVAACYNPSYAPGQLACSPGGECPRGQVCHTDGRCYPPDALPTAGDLRGPAPDLGLRPDLASTDMMVAPVRGFLRTRGPFIVDDTGQVVRLRGVNWTGFDTTAMQVRTAPMRTVAEVVEQIRMLGYNMIRIPYRNQVVENQTALGRLDDLIREAGMRGLRVILARHYPAEIAPQARSGLWYDDVRGLSQAGWMADWVKLAMKYRTEPAVVGFDLHHEPHGTATWGDNNAATDWRRAAEMAGNAILGVHPNVLIIVQGVETIGGDGYWWGGNLKDAKSKPVNLMVANRLVYATNDYSPSVIPGQMWFADTDFGAKLPDRWKSMWGHVITEAMVPVIVAGFGWRKEPGMQGAKDMTWRTALRMYIGAVGAHFAFWRLDDDSFYASLLKADGKTEMMVQDQLKLFP